MPLEDKRSIDEYKILCRSCNSVMWKKRSMELVSGLVYFILACENQDYLVYDVDRVYELHNVEVYPERRELQR